MTRGYRKRVIIFSILALVLFVVGAIQLSTQIKMRTSYFELRDGETALALAVPLEEDALQSRYSYTFSHNGKSYASTTLLPYTKEQMQSLTLTTGGLLPIRFLLNEGSVELATEEKSSSGLPIAISCEDNYFFNSVPPSLTASIVIFCAGGAFALVVLFYFLKIAWINWIIKTGQFAYAVFVEAYPSRFGSNRYMAVRYSYQNDKEEWVEAVTPYAYSPSTVELLKNLQAISIKYRGVHSAVVERL